MLDRPQACQSGPQSAHCVSTSQEIKGLQGASYKAAKLKHTRHFLCFLVTLEEKFSDTTPLTGTCTEKWTQCLSIHSLRLHSGVRSQNLGWTRTGSTTTKKTVSAALDAKNKAYSEWKNGLLSVSRKDRFIHQRSKVRLS